jgi:hypothetical protein
MTVDQAEYTWESTPYIDSGAARPAGRRGLSRGHVVAVLRTTAFLLIATLAILVLLPAAIAAQAAFVV